MIGLLFYCVGNFVFLFEMVSYCNFIWFRTVRFLVNVYFLWGVGEEKELRLVNSSVRLK